MYAADQGNPLVGCDTGTPNRSSLAAPDGDARGTSQDEVARYADSPATYDATLNRIGEDNPGFKGIVGAEDGSQVLILAGTTAKSASSALEGTSRSRHLARIRRSSV